MNRPNCGWSRWRGKPSISSFVCARDDRVEWRNLMEAQAGGLAAT
jgi:hypothetical protein